MHQGDSDEQDSLFKHQNGQASAKERRNLAEIGTQAGGGRMEDVCPVGQVRNQHANEPGDRVINHVIPIGEDLENLKHRQIDNGGDDSPKEI